MTFLLDANILVDLALKREPWSTDATRFLAAAEAREAALHLAATTVTNLFYLVRKEAGKVKALATVDETLASVQVVPVGGDLLLRARAYAGRDFEDDIQIACAVDAGVDLIVTRDAKDFRASPIPAVDTVEALRRLLAADAA